MAQSDTPKPARSHNKMCGSMVEARTGVNRGLHRSFLLSSTALLLALPSPSLAQTFTGSDTTSGPFSSGIQTFYDSSALNVSAANAVSGGWQRFYHSSTLNASAANAVSGGAQNFYDTSTLNASVANAVSGGQQWFTNTGTLNASVADAVSGGAQYFYDSSTLNALSENAVSGANQRFDHTSTLNASAAGAVSGGTQTFYSTSNLNASVANAVSGGEQYFYDSSTLDASAANAVSGGTQRFWNTSALNASAANAVSGGTQTFYATSAINASAANAVSGGNQSFRADSTLNASAANAVSGGTQTFYNSSVLNTSAANAVSGGIQTFYATSALNASAANAVSGGNQDFLDTSTLNASAANAVSGGDQYFYGTSILNASEENAVNGGTQYFYNTSTLNASAANAVSGGGRIFYDTSTFNALVADAVSGGIDQAFYGNSTLNASAANAVSGGDQYFYGTSILNASEENAVNGGTQYFYNTSTLNASAANAVSGGTQFFYGGNLNASAAGAVSGGVREFWNSSAFNASAADAVSGGIQYFYDGNLNGSASNAVSGGFQEFYTSSSLNASAADAVSGGTQRFYNTSTLRVLADNALTATANIQFDNSQGGTGGTLQLNGYSTTVGAIGSARNGSGVITNDGASDSMLTLDTALVGPSLFSGTIQDGSGTGRLGLAVAGGHFTLSGTASHTGGTFVSGGTLLVGDQAGNGTLGGLVTVGQNGTLGGSGTLTGAVTIDGTLSAGNSPGTLTFTNDLTLNAGSTSVFELNSPGILGGAGAAGNDLVVVNGGTLSLGGTLDAHVAAAGYYRLFNHSGALVGAFADGAVTGTGGFVAADPNNPDIRYDVPGQVNLSVLGAGQTMQFWDGAGPAGNGTVDGGDGIWQSFATNWTDETGSANAGWGGSVGVFAGTAGIVNVLGTQSFDTLQFSTDAYRIAGDALSIGVAGGGTFNIDKGVSATVASVLEDGAGSVLRKVGGGTLVLTGNNTYTGGTRLLGGVLSVASDQNLGAATGGLTFDGGVLEVTGTGYSGTGRGIVIDAGGGGFDIADAANIFTLTQDITGTGVLLKQGDGTLVLTGDNSYGNTLVEAGTLIGNTASIRNNIGNAGTVVFDQVDSATFAGDITGLNGADGQMILRGGGALTLAGTSTLDWSVEDGTLVSASDRFTGDLDIASGAGFIFDQAADGTYAGILSGSGGLAFSGGGIVALTGNSAGFSGLSTITGSTLVVNDTLGGSALIGLGGLLAGTGTIGSGTGSLVTIADGGTLAPGNSIGTLTVDGDLVIGAGSRFEVEVAPGGTDSDLVTVTGTATIHGGTVAHIGMTGTYDPTATYTILSATGGLAAGSAFDAVTSDFAFLDPTLGYGANDVTLTLTRNDTGFADVGITRNQRATAGGLESLAFGNDLYDAVVQLDEATARAAFDQLSGDIHGSVTTGLVEDSRHLRNAANDRIRSAFGDVGASLTPVLAYGSDGPVLAPADGAHLGMSAWGSAYGSWGSIDGDGNAAAIDRSTGGVLMGADALVADQIRLGLLAGYSRSSVDLVARASSASIDSYHLGLYGGTQWQMPEGTLSLRGGLAYSWHDIETARSVGFIGFADSLTANYDAGTFQAFGELGYSIETDIARFEPFVNLAHAEVRTGGFVESGGAAALSGTSGSNGDTFTTLGFRAETAIDLGEANARLNGMIGWRHAFGDTTPTAVHAFAGSDAFTIAGNPIGRDALVLDAGLDLDLTPDATLGLSYQGQFASGAQDHGFKANLAIRF